MTHPEGGQKVAINTSVTNSKITAVHRLAFQMRIVVLSVSCVMGGIWGFFGQKDSVFRSVILKNVKGPATKKKKKGKRLNDSMITRSSPRRYQIFPDL